MGAGGEEVFPPIDDRPRPIGLHVPDWFKPSFLDLSEDLDEALAKGKQGLVVYFGMDDCPYCEALFERNFSQPDIETYFREHFDVIALDVLGAREITTVDGRRMTEREYSIELNLNFTPSLLFIDASREPVFAVRGYYPPRRFRAALEFVIDRHFEERRFSEFLALADPPPKFDLDDLNEQDFFASGPHRLDRRAAPASRPLLVFFERRACHACDVLHSETILDQRVRDSLALFDVIQLDLDGDTPVLTPDGQRLRSREWGEQLGIHWAPTLVFFDESGVERIRIDSVVGINRLHNVMQYVLTRGYETEPTYERWRAAPL
ncbi:MAG: thioredoxin family protein [Thioalkalivibrionaceae bacterium]